LGGGLFSARHRFNIILISGIMSWLYIFIVNTKIENKIKELMKNLIYMDKSQKRKTLNEYKDTPKT